MFFVLPFAFIFGVVMGSFVTLASYRLPRGEEIVIRPSYCPSCRKPLSVRELVPLFSWLWQKGRCLQCKMPVSIRYPLIEMVMGLTFTLLTWHWGLAWQTLVLCLLFTTLFILTVTDIEHTIIPDSVQIALLILGFAWRHLHHDAWLPILACAGGGLALGLALHYGYLFLRKKDALGWADVKFFAVAGVWLPFESYVPFLLIAGLLGTLTGLIWRFAGRGEIFPFGPALALSLFVNVMFPDIIGRLL